MITLFRDLLTKNLPSEFTKDEPFIADGLFFNVLITSNTSCIVYL
jgi:hypothetical protein